MLDYIWRRRLDGVHILNVAKTWEKLMLAARIIVAVENPSDVIAISARPYSQRAVLKYAQYTGAQSIAGRFTPGTFTNQITKQFREPRLLIVTDPLLDHQVRASACVAVAANAAMGAAVCGRGLRVAGVAQCALVSPVLAVAAFVWCPRTSRPWHLHTHTPHLPCVSLFSPCARRRT